jgi:acyl-coenzyme A synthetase/AMP-(fatty) acid ligase
VVELVDEIPVNAGGKVMKDVLRGRAEGRHPQAAT